MSGKENIVVKVIPVIKVHQWLPEWNEVKWNPKEHRSKPQQWFYQFCISAAALKALSGVYARTLKERRRGIDDLGIQRRHEIDRSKEIARFVKYGYPWSELGKAKRESQDFKDLKKPGWLPTAIVVNILQANDVRHGKKINPSDLITVQNNANGHTSMRLPDGFTGKEWKYKTIPPVEIIDGQHRLWAFEESELKNDFELPVVAFVGLDLSWQAYLFYTINIKPKKINTSLAFDLYPLLRTEEWLTKFEGHVIYRETRAQELVDLLWSHPESPWHKRINMLGESGQRGQMVSQAAWINSLLATLIKSWEGRGVRIGGLFGAPVGSNKEVLPWSRVEQAAFLIVVGLHLRDAIKKSTDQWAKSLRKHTTISPDSKDDQAFYGPNSLLNQDQGIRAFLYITNDLCYVYSDKLDLESWGGRSDLEGNDVERVNTAIHLLKKKGKINNFLNDLAAVMATYDWRASGAPGLNEQDSLLKAAFRGSGGYKELRKHLMRHVASKGTKEVIRAAHDVIKILGY